jgi:hypothetical protein
MCRIGGLLCDVPFSPTKPELGSQEQMFANGLAIYYDNWTISKRMKRVGIVLENGGK